MIKLRISLLPRKRLDLVLHNRKSQGLGAL
jgi:hypothetical protein